VKISSQTAADFERATVGARRRDDPVAIDLECAGMPRFPDVSSSLAAVEGSVFTRLPQPAAPARFPLHVGDTWLEPPPGCRMQDLVAEEHPGLHRYASPRGLPELLEAAARRVAARSGVATEASDLLITAGATGGLAAAVGATVAPGEEVLLLAPYWPLIPGIVRCFHGVPVAVRVIGAVETADDLVQQVERARTERTVAVYFGSPNNPTGRMLPPDWIAALVEWARARELWILDDEVYEDCVFTGRHVYARSLAPERTFAAHSFSKAFGMAGNRCGYVVGPADRMASLGKVSLHAFYSTPTASQAAALRALDGRAEAWLAQARAHYERAGRHAAQRLGLAEPEGSTFLFVDVGASLGSRGLGGFLADCAASGLMLAPGPSFGPYPTHVRLCYTCCPPEVVERGVEVLAERLGQR
jgi:N-succinyldiaminopimelate aminotransferase